MTVIPLDDRILVRPAGGLGGHNRAGTIEHTDDGLVRGTVIAVGADARVNGGRPTSLPVQAGDTILFAKHLGCEVTFGGVHYWMMKAHDVVSIEVRAVTVSLYGTAMSAG